MIIERLIGIILSNRGCIGRQKLGYNKLYQSKKLIPQQQTANGKDNNPNQLLNTLFVGTRQHTFPFSLLAFRLSLQRLLHPPLQSRIIALFPSSDVAPIVVVNFQVAAGNGADLLDRNTGCFKGGFQCRRFIG